MFSLFHPAHLEPVITVISRSVIPKLFLTCTVNTGRCASAQSLDSSRTCLSQRLSCRWALSCSLPDYCRTRRFSWCSRSPLVSSGSRRVECPSEFSGTTLYPGWPPTRCCLSSASWCCAARTWRSAAGRRSQKINQFLVRFEKKSKDLSVKKERLCLRMTH